MQAVGLSTHIWNNNIKSGFLLAGFPILLLVLTWLFCFLLAWSGGKTEADLIAFANQGVADYAHIIIGAALVWLIIAWLFHSNMINAAVASESLSRKDNPKLYNMLENMCIARGMKMPALRIIESDGLNAFASGISEKSYTITFTRGLLDKLEDDEIEAVMAHELTHIINKDVRLLIISVIFVGMIGFLAQFAFRSMIYGGLRSRRDRRSDGRVMLIAMIVLIVGYIFAMLIRFAISRSREYMADAGAVEITKNPEAMMRALMRISGNDYVEETPADVEQMCIENSHKFMGVFATHPPIERRVQAISETTGAAIPDLSAGSEYAIDRGRNPWAR